MKKKIKRKKTKVNNEGPFRVMVRVRVGVSL
jgi:hypothetical protein